MKNNPLVSIVLATKNGSRTVAHAIDSIINQTYSNIELIIVNDASEDDTLEILNSYLVHKGVLVINNPANFGLAVSLNRGFSAAKGELLARMDDDDFSEPDRIERQVQFLDQHPDVDVLGTGIAIYDESLNFIRNHTLPTSDAEIKKFFIRGNPLAHPTVMMRRQFFLTSGGYDKSLRRMEDLELWGRMANVSTYANLPDHLLRYVIKKNKPLKVILPGIKIRLINGFRLGHPLRAFMWIFVYTVIEIMRHMGYTQKKFRHET